MTAFESAFIAGDGYRAELKIRDWEQPVHTSDRSIDHHLHLNLPPILYRGEMRFPERSGQQGYRVGRSFFRPAGVLVESTGTGGRAYSLDCSMTDRRFAALAGNAPDWSSDVLEAICNLDRSPVFALLARIAEELRLPELGQASMVEALLCQAIVELCRSFQRPQAGETETGRLSQSQLDRIAQRLAAEELAPPTVAELARLCAISERHLLRLFHATMGRSVSAHIRKQLMDRAGRQLAQGRSIKQIAFALGFSGPNSFSMAFRQATGCTPAQWRARSRP